MAYNSIKNVLAALEIHCLGNTTVIYCLSWIMHITHRYILCFHSYN